MRETTSSPDLDAINPFAAFARPDFPPPTATTEETS
jgi:hypothetical protein